MADILRDSDIVRELKSEIREQKRTASGIHSRKGKRGYVGKMLFPTDLMSRKEKYNHRKGGRIILSNLYDEIISKDKLKMLPKDIQAKTIAHWRSKYSTDEITEGMGCTKATYYNIASSLGVTKKGATGTVKAKRTPKVKKETPVIKEASPEIAIIESQPVINGLMMGYSGEFDADQIIKKLEKIGLMLLDEESKFDVEIRIKEIG